MPIGGYGNTYGKSYGLTVIGADSSASFGELGSSADATLGRMADSATAFSSVDTSADAVLGRMADSATAFSSIDTSADAKVVVTAGSTGTFDTIASSSDAVLGRIANSDSAFGGVASASDAVLGRIADSSTTFDSVGSSGQGVSGIQVQSSTAFEPLGIDASAWVIAGAESSTTFDSIGSSSTVMIPVKGESNTAFGSIGSSSSVSLPIKANQTHSFGSLDSVATAYVLGEPVILVLPGDVAFIDLPPNWAESVVVDREFKTDIFVSRSGLEQRRGLRRTPRKKIAYQSSLHGVARAIANAKIAGWQDRRFLLPEYAASVAPAEPVLPGSGVFVTGESRIPLWAKPGVVALLYDHDRLERRFIIKVESDRVVFDTATSTVWNPNVVMLPGLIGRFDSTLATKRPTSNLDVFSVEFSVEATSEGYFNPGTPLMTYRGRELFTRRPNWRDGTAGSFTANVDVLDFGIGPTDYYPLSEFRPFQLTTNHLLKDEAAVRELLKFFHRAMGKQKSFYAPTWQRDYEIGANFSAGSTSFYAFGASLGLFLADDISRKDIAFITRDKQIIPRRIVSQDTGGDFTRIDVDSPIPVSSAEVAMVSWLPRCRFATDTLSLEYVATNRAETDLVFLSLEGES